MANAAKPLMPSAHSLPTDADDLDIATANDVAALRCEEWEVRAELERVLYEHAYRSCNAVEALRESWCSRGDARFNRAAAVEIDYAGAARRFCAVAAQLQ
jgi:hypothetical protein